MLILPAIDLKDGKCVRLLKGEADTAHVVGADAVEVAKGFVKEGAQYIHMVDLDGAFSGVKKNLEIIKRVVEAVDIPVEVGGGIRTYKDVKQLLDIGVARVILGTVAIENWEATKAIIKEFGDKIALAVDVRNKKVATKGWVEQSEVDYLEFCENLEKIGVKTIILTDISKDGTLEGPNLELIKELQTRVKVDIVASGGIRDIENIRALSELGVYGAITGKAIYSGSLNLVEAIKVALEKN